MSRAVVIDEKETLAFLRFATSDEANAAHKRIAGCLQDALGIGEFLTRQKEELGYGNYLPWFDKHMEFGRTTGTKYAKLWDNRDKFSLSENLDLTEAYRIAGVLKEPKPKERVIEASFSLVKGIDGDLYNVSGSDRNPKFTRVELEPAEAEIHAKSAKQDEPVKSWTASHVCAVNPTEPYSTSARTEKEKTVARIENFIEAISKEIGKSKSTIKQWILESLS
jgi:hypothetical protein